MTTPQPHYHVLDETTGEYVYHSDREVMAHAAANAHARDTGHDASVWEGTIEGSDVSVTNTGYYVEGRITNPENPSEKEIPMTTTPTTTPNALDKAYLDASEVLDEMYSLATDLDIDAEFCGPEDGCYISLNFANVDLDPAGGRDVAKQAVAKLRELGVKIARLADAIDERMRDEEEEQDDEQDGDDEDEEIDGDDQEQEAHHTTTHTAYRIMATADDGGAVYPHPLPIGEYPTEESARLGLGRIVAEHDGVNGPGCYWIETPDGRRIFAGV